MRHIKRVLWDSTHHLRSNRFWVCLHGWAKGCIYHLPVVSYYYSYTHALCSPIKSHVPIFFEPAHFRTFPFYHGRFFSFYLSQLLQFLCLLEIMQRPFGLFYNMNKVNKIPPCKTELRRDQMPQAILVQRSTEALAFWDIPVTSPPHVLRCRTLPNHMDNCLHFPFTKHTGSILHHSFFVEIVFCGQNVIAHLPQEDSNIVRDFRVLYRLPWEPTLLSCWTLPMHMFCFFFLHIICTSHWEFPCRSSSPDQFISLLVFTNW